MNPTGIVQDLFGLAGSVLEGQYRADAVVGEGGFGVVYRGQHLSLDQPIAIKMLKGLDGGDANINALVLDKFRSEARLLYTLSQSSLHIVRCLDFGATTTPSGVWAPFMILEWLDGQSLADDLVQRRSQGMHGRSLSEALAILEPVADGLAIAHQQHVAHRDIKPANIFLTHGGRPGAQGRVKVLDFGIAKIMKEGESAGTKGTFASFTWLYAAPEQLDPRIGTTGLATDVYGFALLLTELLTDRRPVEERDVISILKAATNTQRRPSPRTRGANVPDEIEAVCQRALSVDPKHRYPSITELWAALAGVRDERKSVHTQMAMSVMNPNQHPNSQAPSTVTTGPANPMAATNLATPAGGPPPPPPQSLQAASVLAPSSNVISSGNAPVPPQQQQQQRPSARHATALPMSAMPASLMNSGVGTGPPQQQQHHHPQPFAPQQQQPMPMPMPMPMPQPMPMPMMMTGPPTQQPPFGAPMTMYQPPHPQHVSPPLGTLPPGQRRMPFVRSDGGSAIVPITIVVFVLTLFLAGSCAAIHACTG